MKTWLWRVVFSILLFLLFLLPTIDTDFGWQLRCGRELLQFGKLCSPDRYSVLLPGYPWAYPVQVFPVMVAVVFDHFGWWGLSLVNAILMSSTFILLFRLLGDPSIALRTGRREVGEIRGIGVWIIIIVILAIIYFSWGVLGLGLRSQMFSIFFFVLVLYLLKGLKRWWIFPPLFLIWANTHGGFVLGLFVVGVYWLEAVVEYVGERGNKGERGREVGRLTVAAIGSGLATLINPFTWRVYQEDWLHFGGGYHLAGLIAEWVPPAPYILVTIIIFSGSLLLWLLSKKERRLFPYLLILVMSYLALSARRNVPFAFISTAFVASSSGWAIRGIGEILRPRAESRDSGQVGGKLAIAIVAAYLIFSQFPKVVRLNTSWAAYCSEGMLVYPCQAVEFMRTQKEGKMFALYEWGGFLIWQLPQFPNFVDGRMPAWITSEGKSPYSIYLEMIRTEGDWQKKLDDYQIDYIFIRPGTFMDLKLRPNPERFGWRELYRDEIAVVYLRDVLRSK